MKEKKLNVYQRHWADSDQSDVTVFGKGEEGITYEYDDRIMQWDYHKHEKAILHANSKVEEETKTWYVEYLNFYYDKKIDLRHILQGCNRSNGFPYLVFGFKEILDETITRP